MTEPEPGLDTYQGISWAERASLGPLRAAIDPSDLAGRRNELIDQTQRIAVRWGFAEALLLHGTAFSKALDFGCGGGRLTGELAAVSSETWATDRSEAMIRLAKANSGLPESRVVVWPDDGKAFLEGSFDLILSVMVTLTPTLLRVVCGALGRLVADDGAVVMVEQVAGKRGLALADYERELAAVGFVIRSQRVARRGTRSPSLAIAARLRLPSGALRWLAKLEWALAPRIGIASDGYGDCVMVISRVDRLRGE